MQSYQKYKVSTNKTTPVKQTRPTQSNNKESNELDNWYDSLKSKLGQNKQTNNKMKTPFKNLSSACLTSTNHERKIDLGTKTPKSKISWVRGSQVKSDANVLKVKREYDDFDHSASRLMANSVNSEKKNPLQNSKSQKGEFYVYWKNKANAFQVEIFGLRDQNKALKHEIQDLKSKEGKLQRQVNTLRARQQQIKKLQQTLQQNKQDQKGLYIHIGKIQRQLAINRVLLKNMQYKFSKERPMDNINGSKYINDAPLLRSMKDKIRKLQQQNQKYLYIIKQLEQDLKSNAVESIWIGSAKPVISSQATIIIQEVQQRQQGKQRKSKSKEKAGLKRMISLDPCELDMGSTKSSFFNRNSKETIEEFNDQQ